jgi:tetraacyldisaccharide 4'-kinase
MKLFKPKFWDLKRISFFALLLMPISCLINFVVFIKNKTTKKLRFNIPIICIGNIYLGGTGKTPLAIKIFNMLKKIGKKPVIIKKFYRDLYDEALLIKDQVKNIEFLASRVESIKSALSKSYNVAILDDGLQDYSIRKDLSIVCFNGDQLIGNGLTIPSGPLRENLNALKNCQIVIINGEKNLPFEDKIKKISSKVDIYYSKYIPENLENFKKENLFAFAGIGNPNNFFKLLKDNGLNVLKQKSFPDHHIYSQKEVESLLDYSIKNDLKLLTTEKDFYRIKKLGFTNIEYLSITVKIFEEEKLLKQMKFFINNENI